MHAFLGYEWRTWAQFLQVAQGMWWKEYLGLQGSSIHASIMRPRKLFAGGWAFLVAFGKVSLSLRQQVPHSVLIIGTHGIVPDDDPEGVKALLDTLRNSQAWTDALKSSLTVHPTTQPLVQRPQPSSDSSRVPAPGPGDAGSSLIRPSSIAGNPSQSGPSVADLLSQLRASQSLEFTSNAVEGSGPPTRLPPLRDHTSPLPISQTASTHASPPQQDMRTLSFKHALPHISRLMEDPAFAKEVTKMKQEQDKLEKQLWEEREGVRKCHEEKVEVAKTKCASNLLLPSPYQPSYRAKMIGVGLSKHDAESMSNSFRIELRKFDAERVLPAWEGLIRGQQARLEALKVPTMFVTNDAGDVEKQRKVVHVLEGILPTSGPDQ
ncbi:hypothetical protein BJV78DRAFT_1281206 [Lactifluus subvellereus]|nr:hypothetical protein BJV78DRAFT_1281206 [Lactifluus subvellereus]